MDCWITGPCALQKTEDWRGLIGFDAWIMAEEDESRCIVGNQNLLNNVFITVIKSSLMWSHLISRCLHSLFPTCGFTTIRVSCLEHQFPNIYGTYETSADYCFGWIKMRVSLVRICSAIHVDVKQLIGKFRRFHSLVKIWKSAD